MILSLTNMADNLHDFGNIFCSTNKSHGFESV